MKRIFILGLFAVMAYSVCNAEGWQILIGDEVAEELYASDSDSEQQEKTKSRQKSRSKSTSRSTSISKSTSTSNGKTVIDIYTSKNGQPSLKSFKDLAVYPLFGDKYKRHPHASLKIIENHQTFYRSLSINNDKALVDMVSELVERDAQSAVSVVRDFDAESDRAILSMDVDGRPCTIGFTLDINGSSCTIFLSVPY